jgi:hypothetical protein
MEYFPSYITVSLLTLKLNVACGQNFLWFQENIIRRGFTEI